MTTIAYRDGVIAADTQMTVDHVKQSAPPKITTLKNGMIIASAGDMISIAKAHQRLCKDDWENEKYKSIKEFEAIAYWKGDIITFNDSTAPLPLVDEYCAIGSGWEFALAHMAKGYSAADAVLFASTLDIYTNDKIQICTLPPKSSVEGPKKGRRGTKSTST